MRKRRGRDVSLPRAPGRFVKRDTAGGSWLGPRLPELHALAWWTLRSAQVVGVVLAHTGQHPVSRAAARTVVVANVGLEVRGATTEATRVARVRRIGAHGPVAPCSGSGSSTVQSATTISSWSARSPSRYVRHNSRQRW